MNKPIVSIVIPNWNGRTVLKECLRSVMDLTYPNYEVIVVDNGSSDGSPEMVKKEFPQVRIIINERNLGFADGCNVGIKSAKGELIALFNNDAIADQFWLTGLVNTMTESGGVGIVGGPVLYPDQSNIVAVAGARIDLVTGIGWRVGEGKRLDQLGNLGHLDYIPFTAVLVKKEVIERIGLLDGGYFMGWEDADWSIRADRSGYKCRFSPSSIVWHKGSYSRRKIPMQNYRYTAMAFFRFCLTQFPTQYLLTTLFFQLLIIPLSEIFLLRHSVMIMAERIRGVIWNLQRLREVITKRRTNQRLGELSLKNRFKECIGIAIKAKDVGRVPLA